MSNEILNNYDDYVAIMEQLGQEAELSAEEFDALSEEDLTALTGAIEDQINALNSEEDEDLEESTAAANSLKTHGVQSKADAMAHLMGAFGQTSEWVEKFKKAMEIFGAGKDHGVGDVSGKNSSSIDTTLGSGPKTADPMPRLNVKEDVEAMFNGQELSEEFKDKATTLFEAALEARVIVETQRLQEEFDARLEEEVTNVTEEITTKLDTYLDYVVENWMKENQVAIESTLRNEIMEEFIDGLKNLFAEHYISVPEEKVEVVEALAQKVDELEARLDETITENAELKGALLEESKQDIFETLSENLTLTQQEKFAALAEGIEFDGDLEVYGKKLEIIKENYFSKSQPTVSTNIEEETFEGEQLQENTSYVDPNVNRYVKAIARTVKGK